MSNTTAADLTRIRKGRILKPEEQERALLLLSRGLTRTEVWKRMRISNATWTCTMESVPGFRAACEEVHRQRLQEVEVEAFRLALGGSKTVKMTYQAEVGRDGVPKKDEMGKPILHLVKREVSLSPPNWDAVKFLLQVRMPETYSSKALAHDQRAESLDMIRALLEGRLKDMEGQVRVEVGAAHVALPAAEGVA